MHTMAETPKACSNGGGGGATSRMVSPVAADILATQSSTVITRFITKSLHGAEERVRPLSSDS